MIITQKVYKFKNDTNVPKIIIPGRNRTLAIRNMS